MGNLQHQSHADSSVTHFCAGLVQGERFPFLTRVPPNLSADPGDFPGFQLIHEPTCKHGSNAGMQALDKAWEPLREARTPTLTVVQHPLANLAAFI